MLMARLLFIILFGITAIAARSQLITQSPQQLLAAYNKAQHDTAGVRLLLKIDSLYLYQKPDIKPVLDSALLMARQAQRMSSALGYRSGYNDGTFMAANAYAERGDMSTAAFLADSVTGILRVRILIMIGERYLFRPGEFKQNTDSSFIYIQLAEKASDYIHSMQWLYESRCLKGKYYFTLGDLENGKRCFETMIRESHRHGKLPEEAHWHAELGKYMPHTDSTYNDVLKTLGQALAIYTRLGDREQQVEVLEGLVFLHKLRTRYLGLAEKELLQVIALRKALPSTRLFQNYTELSEINILQGNYNISLNAARNAVKELEAKQQEGFHGGVVYSQMAAAYKAVGDKSNSLLYFRKALGHLVEFRNEYLFPIGGKIVESLLELDSPRQALSFLQTFVKQNPPQRIIDREIVAACMGNCYNALRYYSQAEKHYLQMILLDAQAQAQMAKQVVGERSNTITGSEAYYTIGNFFVERQQFARAEGYLQKAVSFRRFAPSVERSANIHLLLFRIDSAQHNFVSAIRHLQTQQHLRDSLFTDRKSKQIAEYQIRYATEKKEKDLEILSAQEEIKDKELQRTVQVRNFTYLLIVVLIVLIIVGYGRFVQNQRSKRKLEAQQGVIDRKNWQLQKLITDKDKLLNDKDNLLEDKERLIREIHHRVKNNLQIVISLLNTQSKYLNSKEAIHAITESRHRMQAMSLIHEKLYQSDDTSSVHMQNYITELAGHLKTSFDQGSLVQFQVDVDPIELDLSQAIPLGLILNEVITNSIKYAFADRQAGIIRIRMARVEDDMILLHIRDNGRGLPDGMDVHKTSSMGIRLVNGLARQLNAHLTVEGTNGVGVYLKFAAHKAAVPLSGEAPHVRVGGKFS